MCEFDTGVKGSSVADHVSKSGVSHNYVAFANTGDGDGLTHSSSGALNVTASVVVGPPTVYAGSQPFANIEYDVSHTSTPLQAIAGGGTREALSRPSGCSFPGLYIGALTSTELLDGSGDSYDPKVYANTWSINNAGGRTQASTTRVLTFQRPARLLKVIFTQRR